MINLDLNKIPQFTAFIIVTIILSVTLAPFWYLFQFEPKIFDKYNLITLLLISSAMGSALYLCNTVVYILLEYVLPKKEPAEVELVDFVVAAALNFLVFYSPCFIAFRQHHVSGQEAMVTAIGTESVGILTWIILSIVFNLRKRNFNLRNRKK